MVEVGMLEARLDVCPAQRPDAETLNRRGNLYMANS
jgi:hypothetical protein